MQTYAIHEDNISRLEKRLTTIKNKCAKYGSTFHYQIVGEEFRSYTDSLSVNHTVRYLLVEAEGQVIHNDWEFVGTIAHEESGNVIRQYKTDIEVPSKYYTTSPICEHCNTKRRRKDTYLIHNTLSDEWKQVGKTCLDEFTNGMDAEDVARYISLFDALIQGESFSGSRDFQSYFPTLEILQFAFETVSHFGYEKSDWYAMRPTKDRCMDYYYAAHGIVRWMSPSSLESLRHEMQDVKFNADSEENKNLAQDAIEWIKNESENNSYIHNLKVICSSDYCSNRNLGILISLAHTYRKHIKDEEERINKDSEHKLECDTSQYVGEEGKRISFLAKDVNCIHTSFNAYGVSFMYKMHDEDGNVYMWSTSTELDLDLEYNITGTVKKHEEFNGVKQTWITRCRANVVEKVSQDAQLEDSTFDLDEAFEVFSS